ncbi:copper resistance CopC family protein [Janibacter sp. GS2]|uniref:copper resistance CopC family protein n=1 Tax=Janibacter sp. GS2 TaxID=3442646 RepID=UPI003EB9D311
MTTSASPHASFVRVAGALLGLVALLAVLVASASPASAHARLKSSSPADGSTLTAVPPEIALRFNEPIKDDLNEVSVKSGSTDVTDGAVEVDGSSVYQPVKYSMKPGKYSVSYKVVSADGHPVSGTLSFTYDPPEGDTGASGEPGATTSSPASGSSTAEPSESPDSSGSSTSSDSSSSSSATDEEPSESSSGTSVTSEPSSTSGSETSSAEPTEPSTSSTSTDAAAGTGDETSGGDGTSPWWWVAAAAALAVVLGGIALLARGRRDAGDDEAVTLEEWRE